MRGRGLPGSSSALANIPTPAVGDVLVGASGGRFTLLHTAAGVTPLLAAFTSANLLAALASDKTGTGQAVFSDSPVFTTQIAITRNALGAVSQAGSVLQNLTPAVNGTQQFSPMAVQTAQGFDTVAGASKPLDFCSQVEPNQTAGNPTGNLRWYVRQNNGAWVSACLLSSSGTVSAAASLIAAANVTAGADISTTAGSLTATRTGIGTTTVDGLRLTETTVSSIGTPVQYAPGIHFTGRVLNTTGNTDETSELTLQFQPVSGTTPSSQWVFLRNRNGAGNVVTHTFFDNGNLVVAGALTAAVASTFTAGLTATTGNIQASAGQCTAIRNNITTVNTIGFQATNQLASTVSVTVQQSPDIEWDCSAWNSVGAVSETSNWRAFVLPATAAGTTSSTWKLQRQIAGGGYADIITATSAGSMTVNNSLTVSNAITASTSITANAGPMTASRNAIGTGFTHAFLASNGTTALVGTPNQWSPSFRATGSVYDGTVGQTVNWRHELQTAASGSAAARADYVFSYSNSGVSAGAWAETLRLLGPGGMQLPTAVTPPTNPPAGSVAIWFDGTNLKAKNSAGTAVTWA